MEESVAKFALINFVVIGLSHALQHRGWRDFFRVLHANGRAGAFANGLMTLVMGAFIVSFHNIWTGLPTVLTIVGWLYLLKSVSIFLYPDWSVRSMKSVETASAIKFRIAGVGMIGLSITVAICVFGDAYSAV